MSSQPLQQFPSSSSHACSSPSFPPNISVFSNQCQSASSSSSCPPPPLPFPSTISSLIPDPLARMLQQQQQLLHQQNHNNHHNHHNLHHHHPHNHQQQQQHEQDSPQKAFVCEICGKAFRFRSNLAEHRSVHTAVKPFVCKFCGKSSRLKGNLTKHILKHHKSEQRDYIGTEEYIIKKGKKAVKDPAAIEFLEKSMIVLNNNNNGNNDNNGHNSNGNISSTGTGAEQSPATVEEEMSNAGGGGGDPIFDLNSQPATAAQNLLLSLGFDGINLDLKREAFSPADNGGDPFAAFFSQNATNANVEEEGMEAEGSEGKPEEEEEEEEEENESRQSSSGDQQQQQGSPQMVDHQQQNGTAANVALAAAACKAFLRQIPQIVDGKQLAKVLFGGAKPTTAAADDQMEMDGNWATIKGEGQPLQPPQQVNEDEVMRLLATFGGGGGGTTATPQKRHDNEPTKQQKQQHHMAINGIGGGGACRMATQCQQCGKHFRKPRDLTAHLSSAHKKASASSFSSTASCVPLLPSRGANANAAGSLPFGTPSAAILPFPFASSIAMPNSTADDFAASSSLPPSASRNKSTAIASSSSRDEAVLQELRQLRATLAEMKAAGGMGGNGIGRVEQQLALLDQRVCRLEKQLEMALNSIYTLVQLQTGINNNVSKLSRTMMNNSQGHSQ